MTGNVIPLFATGELSKAQTEYKDALHDYQMLLDRQHRELYPFLHRLEVTRERLQAFYPDNQVKGERK